MPSSARRTVSRVALAVAAAATLPGVRALSDLCREDFAKIQNHAEYKKVTEGSGGCSEPKQAPICRPGFYKFCRLRIENKLTACCETLVFSDDPPTAVDCRPSCETQCKFAEYEETCEVHLGGEACIVTRYPFMETIPGFKLEEYFCLPQTCKNDADLAGIMEHYAYSWQEGREEAWRKDYSEASVSCDDGFYGTGLNQWVFFTIFTLALVLAISFCLVYLMYVPPSLRKAQTVSPEDQKYRAVEVLKKMNTASEGNTD